METYAEDMAKAIEGGTGGLIKKIIHGEEQHEIEKENLSPQSKKNKLFMYLSMGLILCGSLILAFFIFSREKIATIPIEPQFVPIIFSDETHFQEVGGLSKDRIVKDFQVEVQASKVKAGGVEGIYLALNKKVIGLRKFIELIKGNFVPTDPEVYEDAFLMGFVNNQAKFSAFPEETAIFDRDFFMIMKVRSIPEVFSDLRAWERKMFFDLSGFVGVDINVDTTYLLTKDFEDGIIGNKNARILYDMNSQPVLMYIFANDTSVLITSSEQAADEVILRLTKDQG